MRPRPLTTSAQEARSNQASNKNENMRGGPASHIDQGRHSRFTARVLLRPGLRQAVCALRPQSIVVKFKILPFGNKM